MSDEYQPAWEWKRRALLAEKRLADALDCLGKMADGMPEPWGMVAKAAYLGCGGTDRSADRVKGEL